MRLFPGALENISASVFGQGFVGFKKSMRTISARMHDPLRDALMIKVKDLLTEMEILDESWSERSDLEHVLVVGERAALRGDQDIPLGRSDLVQLSALPAHEGLVMDGCGIDVGVGGRLLARHTVLVRVQLP